MIVKTFEDVIREHVTLGTKSGSGWLPCVHVGGCDKGHKGRRAAWQLDGNDVVFNCFNCGVTTGYSPHKCKSMPDKMVKVLGEFNIPDVAWQAIILENLGTSELTIRPTNKQITIDEPKTLELPIHFYELGDANSDDKWDIIGRDYLENRGINPDASTFYLSTGVGDKKWKSRIIIPMYKNGNLIFYQGRALINLTRKYESPSVSKATVFAGFDRIFDKCDDPIYVVEGWFDAESINGVGVLGNKMSDIQIEWLKQSPRKKVIIPDMFGDGYLLAEQAIKLGWYVSIPEISNCKDVSEAVNRFGKIYTLNSISKNTMSGVAASVAVNMFCKK